MSNNRRNFLSKGGRSALTVGILGMGAGAACGRADITTQLSKAAKPTKQVISGSGKRTNLPFSPAILFGNLLFISGQMAIDPETRRVVEGGIGAETRYILENFRKLLESTGSSLAQVLKCTVFLSSAADFQAMNEVYRTFFPVDPPARSTIAAGELVVPGGHVEIECFACVD